MALTFIASRIVCDILAFLYPAYLSFKALKSRHSRDIVAWLMYWICLAFFSTFETILDIFVFWLPFYYEVKMAFVLWLILPWTKGHIIIYRQLIHPVLTRHEQAIDDALVDVHERAKDVSSGLGKKSLDLLGYYAKSGTVNLKQMMFMPATTNQGGAPDPSSLFERNRTVSTPTPLPSQLSQRSGSGAAIVQNSNMNVDAPKLPEKPSSQKGPNVNVAMKQEVIPNAATPTSNMTKQKAKTWGIPGRRKSSRQSILEEKRSPSPVKGSSGKAPKLVQPDKDELVKLMTELSGKDYME